MSNQKACFVVMGFGKKTDFETGRVLDLDASYQYLIKPAVEAAELKCIRADEIRHSGLIDDPMYDQLLNADVVVADLSTSNRNAIYELGVRHALRPYTTVIIAEEGLMKSPFFDLSHIVIRTYKHLGEDIGVGEMRRFTAELTAAIKEITARQPMLQDSPVYRFLQGLEPPFLRNAGINGGGGSAPVADAPCGPVPPDSGDGGQLDSEREPSAPKGAPSGPPPSAAPGEFPAYSELMGQVNEAQKAGDWREAKRLLEQMRTIRKQKIEAMPDEHQIAKSENPEILQRLALATYKSQDPDPEKALMEARDLLLLLEPRTSNHTETLGLWGSVHKQLWNLTRKREYLDEAVWGYEIGFYIRNDYYNGINFAFLLNVRAAQADDPAEAIADFVQAKRARKEIIEICERWLQANPEPKNGDVEALDKYRERKYWVIATLAEAYFGSENEPEGQRYLTEAYAIDCPYWMKEATKKQLAALRPLLANSPLSHISQA
jgi:hypothetical protein